jgi:hypothetical protein
MMKNNVKKNSVAKKLVPAAGMLALSASMLATSTYAWFTMNKEVTVTGMQLRTTVGSNLLISATNENAASYQNNLNQLRECTLEPASTKNGINFFWTPTSNVDAAGAAKTVTYTAYTEDDGDSWNHTNAAKTAYDEDFNTTYGFTTPTKDYEGVAYGYLDYTFYLKAVNTEASAQDIKLTKLNFLYNGVNPTNADGVVDKAWRVALMAKETTLGETTDDPGANDVVSIFTIDGAHNFTYNAASDSTPQKDLAIGAANTAAQALSYGSAWNNSTPVDYYNKAGSWGNMASGAEKYYKVVVRMWLEGEDTTCTNQTYATLKNDYTLDLKFEFSQGNAVTKINNGTTATGNATNTVSGAVSTAALTVSGKTAASYQWYNFNSHTAIDGATDQTYTATANGIYYCVITDTNGNTYVTPAQNVTVS